jgi:hypothetical protein
MTAMADAQMLRRAFLTRDEGEQDGPPEFEAQ